MAGKKASPETIQEMTFSKKITPGKEWSTVTALIIPVDVPVGNSRKFQGTHPTRHSNSGTHPGQGNFPLKKGRKTFKELTQEGKIFQDASVQSSEPGVSHVQVAKSCHQFSRIKSCDILNVKNDFLLVFYFKL